MSDIYKVSKIYKALQHGETLVKELHTQFKEGRNCDLEIRLNRKRLYVHKCLIDTFFIKAGAELEDDRFYLDLSRYTEHVVEALIGLVYTGNLRCSLDQVEKVYKAAVDLGFVEAQTGCMTYLRESGIQNVLNSVATSEAILPEPFPIEDQTELEPNVVIKTEPMDDGEGAVNESFTQPVKKTDYRSTLLVPVSTQSLGAGTIPGLRVGAGEQVIHYNLDSQVNFGNFKTSTSYNKVNNVKPLPALPAQKIQRPLQKKAIVEYVYPKKSNDNTPATSKRKGRQPKVACLEKKIVDKIRNLSEQNCEGDSDSSSRKSLPENQSISVVPEKQNISAATEELSINNVSNDCEKNNLVEYRTKSGTVYYKYANPNSVSNDEFSVDTDTDDTSHAVSSTKKFRDKLKPATQTALENWMQRVSTIVKTENEEPDNCQTTSTAEDEQEAQKKEQMLSLGLTKTVDKSSLNIEGNGPEKSGKRKLRARKKVDYLKESIEHSSDFDDDSDYIPYEGSRKKIKPTKGKSFKIEPSSLVTIGDKNDSLNQVKKDGGSKTIAIRQELRNTEDDDDGYEETAYFPPAGSVPEGVRSRYAQGKFMKVKYVTESTRDARGNVTVVTKPVPVRPRQFGIDERLMNRPAVYVCHPTAPVVKPVVRKQTW